MNEWQWLLHVLHHLIEVTRGHHLEPILARKVDLLKIVIRQAQEEGGLDHGQPSSVPV